MNAPDTITSTDRCGPRLYIAEEEKIDENKTLGSFEAVNVQKKSKW